MSWLGSVMHIMHISFPKIRVTDTVLRVFGDHMMAHKRPSLSSDSGHLDIVSKQVEGLYVEDRSA